MMPPLGCPERLSLFASALLLHPEDMPRRLAAMYTCNTHQRLTFCKGAMDMASWAQLDEVVADGAGAEDVHSAAARLASEAPHGQGDLRPWERMGPNSDEQLRQARQQRQHQAPPPQQQQQ